MRKKRRKSPSTQPAQPSHRPKRTAHSNNIAKPISKPSPKKEIYNTTSNSHSKHYNADMRAVCDINELKQWVNEVSPGKIKFGVGQYFIGQKCEQFPGDVFKSDSGDISNFFLCMDSDKNKIHKAIPNFDSTEDSLGKGIIVKSVNEDFCSGKKVFILFEDLYKDRYSGEQIILNAVHIHNQFERITHYPMQGVCIKIMDNKLKKKCVGSGVDTIINFKI